MGLTEVGYVAEAEVHGGIAGNTEVAHSAAPMSNAAEHERHHEERGQPWRFRLGQCISHKDQSMPSLVLSRVRADGKKNMEIYGVRSFATVDPQRDRIILGDCLVDVIPGSAPCMDCLLFNTGMCPGQATKALEAA